VGRCDLAQDRDPWLAVVNTVMNIRIPQKAGTILTSRVTVSFSGTLLHGVTGLVKVLL